MAASAATVPMPLLKLSKDALLYYGHRDMTMWFLQGHTENE